MRPNFNNPIGMMEQTNKECFKSRKLLLYVFASAEEHFLPLCALFPSIASFLPGGSPYPDINARKIAQKLQEGYRMPKPKHVEIKL